MEYRYMLLKSDGNEVHNMAKRNIPDPGGYLASHMRRAEGGLHIKGLFAKKKEEDEPLVSIITVVRNAERHLEKTIQSVIKQTYNNIEYIIIDGASTDGTLGIIHKYDDSIAYWVSEPDGGPYEAMNKALAVMSGDYWACLSSDDLYRPSTVGLAVTAFQANHEIDIVYGDLEIISENGVYLAPYRYPEFDKKRFRLNVNPCQHGHACTFLRARVYDDMGGFDERYKYAGDYEYFLRATEHGINMLHQPTLRAQMTIHALQISNKYRNEQWQEHVSIYQRYYGTPRMNAWSLIDNTRRYIRNRRYYLSKILPRPCG